MLGLIITVVVFVAALKAMVRFAGLGVRKELSRQKALALAFGFFGLVLLAWWLLTYVDPNERLARRLPHCYAC